MDMNSGIASHEDKLVHPTKTSGSSPSGPSEITGCAADTDGKFEIDLATGYYRLEFSAVGFVTEYLNLEIKHQPISVAPIMLRGIRS